MVKISLNFWDSSLYSRLRWVMKDNKLYKVECGEMSTVKSTFQRRICQLIKAVVWSSGEKHDISKHGDLLQKKKPKQNRRNNYGDIKMKVLGWFLK